MSPIILSELNSGLHCYGASGDALLERVTVSLLVCSDQERLPHSSAELAAADWLWTATLLRSHVVGCGAHFSNPYTRADTCETSFCLPESTKVTKLPWHATSLTASAEGDTSLMWVCHITRTPGCSAPNVHNQHSLG